MLAETDGYETVTGNVDRLAAHRRLVEKLDEIAQLSGCYKSILDCNEAKVPFYEKTNFARKSVQMAKYYH